MLSSAYWTSLGSNSKYFIDEIEELQKERRRKYLDLGVKHSHTSSTSRRSSKQAQARQLPNRSQYQFAQALSSLEKNYQEKFIDNNSTNSIYNIPMLNDSYDQLLPINWDELPLPLRPEGGNLPSSRILRKRKQVERMLQLSIYLVKQLQLLFKQRNIKKKIKVVEFCAGSGYIILPLSYYFPDVECVLLDRKEESLNIGQNRINDLKKYSINEGELLTQLYSKEEIKILDSEKYNSLYCNFANKLKNNIQCGNNIYIVDDDIQKYDEEFDLGIALHACGSASDITLEKCLASRACFVICPCCIGKINHYRDSPLSQDFCGVVNKLEFQHLVKAADIGHGTTEDDEDEDNSLDISKVVSNKKKLINKELNLKRRNCKFFIEEDRRLYSQEKDYSSILIKMENFSSCKNDIIVGIPRENNFSHFI